MHAHHPSPTFRPGEGLTYDEWRFASFANYTSAVVDKLGMDKTLGNMLGYADGSRVGLWRTGRARPNELAVLKMARYMGDKPDRVLRLAGYDEFADLLGEGDTDQSPYRLHALKTQLQTLKALLDAAIATAKVDPEDNHGA